MAIPARASLRTAITAARAMIAAAAQAPFDVSQNLDLGHAVRSIAPSGANGQSGVYTRAPTSTAPKAAPIRADRLFDLRTPEGRASFQVWRWEYEDRWSFGACDSYAVFRTHPLHVPYGEPDVWGQRCPRAEQMTPVRGRCVVGLGGPVDPKGPPPCHAAGSVGDARSGQPCFGSPMGRTRPTTTTTCVASATKATSIA